MDPLLEREGELAALHAAEHAGLQAVEDDIRAFLASAFLASHEKADGSYATVNPFRYAMSDPIPEASKRGRR